MQINGFSIQIGSWEKMKPKVMEPGAWGDLSKKISFPLFFN
jgi:hypothetical protein